MNLIPSYRKEGKARGLANQKENKTHNRKTQALFLEGGKARRKFRGSGAAVRQHESQRGGGD